MFSGMSTNAIMHMCRHYETLSKAKSLQLRDSEIRCSQRYGMPETPGEQGQIEQLRHANTY